MEIPRISPVGLRETPAGFRESARRYPPAQRWLAGALLTALLGVVTLTTALSLGAYCLTTDTIDTSSLPGYSR